MYPLFFVIFGQKSAFVYQPHMQRSGKSSEALCVAFGRVCYVSICGLLGTFAMPAFVVTLLTPWYPAQGVQVGML